MGPSGEQQQPSTKARSFILDRPSRKIILIGLLIAATMIGEMLVSGVIDEREDRQNSVRREFTQSWGPEQTLSGPLLVVPYVVDPDKPRQYLKIVPNKLRTTTHLSPEKRQRGVFSATVYEAATDMQGEFVIPSESGVKELLGKDATLAWADSFVFLEASGLAGMTPRDVFTWNGDAVPWRTCREVSREDHCHDAAILAARPSPASQPAAGMTIPFAARTTLRGTDTYSLRFQAKEIDADIDAPWTTPSFMGNRLPSTREVTPQGFSAHWQSVEYSVPRSWASAKIPEGMTSNTPIGGVTLLEATPTYRMIHRASKYGVLFVVLSFTTYFLFELLSGVRIHAVQYGLLGVSLTLFGLLLVSLSEPLGYTAGYVSSAALVFSQASLYTAAIARRPRQALIFAIILACLFGFLYIVLSLESYALLTGSVALFAVLSAVMVLTQRVDWSTGLTKQG